jgi:bifunctional non-homologous end joining protein LigD
MGAMRPMLATPADPERGLPADGERWAYEVKWDGMRVLADIAEGELTLRSRTGRDVLVAFPEFEPLAQAHADVLLDGEIVVLSDGVPSFAALAERMHVRESRRAAGLAAKAPATFIAFDALRMYGVDLTTRTWQERREALERLGPSGDAWQLSPVYSDRDSLVAATVEQGLEGVVAKRRGSRYHPGVRSPDWVKLAHKHVQTCVVGGWRPEVGAAGGASDRIGALLLGVWEGGTLDAEAAGGAEGGEGRRLRFAGRVGSGLAAAGAQADLVRLLRPLRRQTSPFDTPVPREDAVTARWVEPQVVVEVRHLGRTEGGRLRQPVFRGVRDDVEPDDVRDE